MAIDKKLIDQLLTDYKKPEDIKRERMTGKPFRSIWLIVIQMTENPATHFPSPTCSHLPSLVRLCRDVSSCMSGPQKSPHSRTGSKRNSSDTRDHDSLDPHRFSRTPDASKL